MLILEFVDGKIIVNDQSTKDQLKKSSFGYEEGGKYYLYPEEALFVMDIRNAECTHNGKSISSTDFLKKFQNQKKFMTRYFAYKDWRDRGLAIMRMTPKFKSADKSSNKAYPVSLLNLPKFKIKGEFFEDDLLTIIEDEEKGRQLYNDFWLGQYGSYKAADRGKLNKLDIYETIFLIDHKMLSLSNSSKKNAIHAATLRRKDFTKLYKVYKEWREKGYVIKTGFKFGTHFRIYFPGAKPIANDTNWVHSKHVVHVFPKESKLLISEWARAIRVAHSVRKTFILAIPGKITKRKVEIDYILYHREGSNAASPENSFPKYLMLAINEENYIGGEELAASIREAKDHKIELIIAIVDRETAVTYYKIRRIELAKSTNEYYEIDWIQP
jgi:tRNA-intron endonuclease